jgi:anti-sigma regulatory factor (Ser/Thr protein kinase)
VQVHLHLHIPSGIVAEALTVGAHVPKLRLGGRFMYQGRPAAAAQAAGDRYASRQPAPARPSPPRAGRCRLGLAPVPESARAAREFTVATLHEWRLESLTEDAVVIASELATNAILHGTPAATGDVANDPKRARVELSWCLEAGRLICEVIDQAGTPPAVAAQDPEAETGHGLRIVGALAVAWGWTILGTGEKAVWAALDLPGHADAAAGSAPVLAAEPGRGASPAAVRDMRAAGRAADPGRRDPFPTVR